MGEADDGGVFPHNHQSARITIGQRPKQQSLYSAENSGVSADSKGQHASRDNEEAGIVPELTKSVAKKVAEVHSIETYEKRRCSRELGWSMSVGMCLVINECFRLTRIA
jgi:hypothetical protein